MNIKLGKAKWIVPVLAVLVILESVLIVQKLTRSNKDSTLTSPRQSADQAEAENYAQISFQGDETAVAGQETQVTVTLTPLKALFLDGADILIGYDPEYVEVKGVSPTDKFSYLAKNWIEPEKKRVLVTMVETDLPEGVQFTAGDQVNLLTLTLTPLKAGQTDLTILRSEDRGETVLASAGDAVSFEAEEFEFTIKEE